MSSKMVGKLEGQHELIVRESADDARLLYPEELKRAPTSSTSLDHAVVEKPSEKMTIHTNFVRMVTKVLKTQTLHPVQAPSSPSVVRVRRVVYVLAWTTCLLVICCSAYLVMLYGLKMGAVSSKQWLSSVLMSVGEEIVITGPARLVASALVLSLAYRRTFEVYSHRVAVEETLELRPPNDDEYVDALITKRNHPMYAPMGSWEKTWMLRRQQERNNWWTLVDFALGLMFVVVLNQLISTVWTSNFHANSNANRLITTDHPSQPTTDPDARPDFHRVLNIRLCESYMYNTFAAAIFKLRWYNGDLFRSAKYSDKYWTVDSVNRLMGYPQVRQLRVTPKKCVNLVGLRGHCTPRWTWKDMDTDLYGLQWSTATFTDSHQSNDPWRYTERSTRSITTVYRLYGASGRVYDSGGYLQSVPSDSLRRARVEIGSLQRFNWQNRFTRAVFIELTLYNVNMHMFSQVTLIVEYLISGPTLSLARVTSVEGKLRFNVWYFLFVLFILYYFLRLVALVNRQGLLEYLKDFNNKCQMTVVVLGFATIVLAIFHHFQSTSFVTEFERKGKQEYFNFDLFFFYFFYLQFTMSLLLAVAIIRMFMLLRLGRLLLSNFYTFIISRYWIFLLTVVAVILYHVLHTVAKLMQIFTPNGLKDIVIIKSEIHCDNFIPNCVTLNYFLAVKLFTTVFTTALFFVIFTHYSKIAKFYKPKPNDNFNFATFLQRHITRNCFNKGR